MSPLKTPSPATPIKRPQVGLMLGAVFLVYLAQMTLNPIIAPLAREVGLAEWQVGVMISVAAICIMISSQFWGRKSLSWGRKPVLIGALTLAMLSMVAFALLARLGMAGILGGVGLFLLLVLVRGVFFGLAMAAVPPTAQAYIADVTETEEARVKGMAGIGAVQGIAMISGSIIGGLLAGFGLMVPLIFVPCVLAVGALLVLVLLRRESPRELLENPPHVRLWDSRVWPFLAAGFGMFTALGLIQVIAGFIIQDRFSLDSRATAVATAAAFLVSGIWAGGSAGGIGAAPGLASPPPAARGGRGGAAGFCRDDPHCRYLAFPAGHAGCRARAWAGNAGLCGRALAVDDPRGAGGHGRVDWRQ